MNKKYDNKIVEQGKNKKWIAKKYFSTHDQRKKPYSIILPPPNVTGQLHLGHALNGFIQDTLIRYQKMQGFDVCWIPGFDHAGIATQSKVEEHLAKTMHQTRFDLGREALLNKTWEWKETYAKRIEEQWAKLGLALDYSAQRFTLDENMKQAVNKVFLDLYQRQLIYRGTRAINWDPKLQTTLSNIEVENRDTQSQMYYFKYPLVQGGFVKIATTRPETMYSDVAIGINPKDPKLAHLIGQYAISPLTKKELLIIGDDSILVDKGTGAMKISAHATIDIDLIIKNNLEIIECIDQFGLMNAAASDLVGLDRFVARKKVVEKLQKYLVKTEEITSAISYSTRSGAIIEILVQPQWFVRMKPLAQLVLDHLNTSAGVAFYPKHFVNTLKTWMENVQDWCISRQLWWGHRLPVWYKQDQVKVQITSPGQDWKQDQDVLDTWFSSALAPFAFMGWPNQSKTLKRYYPTALLVTGYDIIFFWVARMYFQGLDIMQQKPFHEVLIHGLVRDQHGRKMSKSLGNGIDPMEIIDQYGADALRWFLITNSTPGQDLRFSITKIEAAWNLNNKLWNISRYILKLMPIKKLDISDADLWIEQKLNILAKFVERKIKTYDFTIIAKALTKFIVEDFSGWYIEMLKIWPNQNFAKKILAKLLIVLHPFLPFITDHIYNLIDGKEILEATWNFHEIKNSSAHSVDQAIAVIKLLRDFKVKQNMSGREKIGFWTKTPLSNLTIQVISKLANGLFHENYDALIPLGDMKIYVQLSDQLRAQEERRIKQKINFLKSEIKRAQSMLNNPRFLAKAPQEKINLEKAKLVKYSQELKEVMGGK